MAVARVSDKARGVTEGTSPVLGDVPVEPSSDALQWAGRHRQTCEALVRVGYTRAEALGIMCAENWMKIYEPDPEDER